MPSKEVLDSLQHLHEELEKLEPAIKHVEIATEIINTVKAIPDKHVELIEKIKRVDEEFKDNLSEIFENNVKEIGSKNHETLNKVGDLSDVISDYHEKLIELKDAIANHYKNIESINFPERLDKLDNNISAINIGIQNLQTRIGDFERGLLGKIESGEKRQKVFSYVSISLLVIIMFSIFLLISGLI